MNPKRLHASKYAEKSEPEPTEFTKVPGILAFPAQEPEHGELSKRLALCADYTQCPDAGMMLKEAAKEIDRLTAKLEAKDDKLQKITDWCRAYPLEVFPPPDKEYFAKAHAVLAQHELSLTRISADNMRHVLDGIKGIVSEALKGIK